MTDRKSPDFLSACENTLFYILTWRVSLSRTKLRATTPWAGQPEPSSPWFLPELYWTHGRVCLHKEGVCCRRCLSEGQNLMCRPGPFSYYDPLLHSVVGFPSPWQVPLENLFTDTPRLQCENLLFWSYLTSSPVLLWPPVSDVKLASVSHI